MSTTTLKPAGQWAQEEFAFADLGEPRLNKRVVKIATHLATSPGGTLPQAFPNWAELKAAYRFFDNPRVDFPKVVRPHLERTRLACREPGEYLIIEDTTVVDFSAHPRTRGLGVIGDGEEGGLSCTVRWLSGWRVGPWSSGPRAKWLASLSSNADGQSRHLKERLGESAWDGDANPVGGRRRCSEPALRLKAAAGFTSPTGSLIFTSRSKSAGDRELILLFGLATTDG